MTGFKNTEHSGIYTYKPQVVGQGKKKKCPCGFEQAIGSVGASAEESGPYKKRLPRAGSDYPSLYPSTATKIPDTSVLFIPFLRDSTHECFNSPLECLFARDHLEYR